MENKRNVKEREVGGGNEKLTIHEQIRDICNEEDLEKRESCCWALFLLALLGSRFFLSKGVTLSWKVRGDLYSVPKVGTKTVMMTHEISIFLFRDIKFWLLSRVMDR